jgi:protein-tyrosine phosphatase
VRGVDRKLAAVAEDGWVGVRLPAHTGTRELLAALPFPVVMTSANRTGEAPMCDPDAIAAAFGADLGYLVDDGPSRMGEASTVLRVGPGRFEVLREGLLALPELRRSAGLRIAFVCTGNTCRSPMAEGLAREALGRGLAVPPSKIGAFGFEVGSMGIFAADGAPAADHGVAVMARRGIDIASHRARTASEAIVADLDRVYGLTDSHVEALRTMLPARQRSRVELLDPEGRGVPDPIGGSVEDYAACADAIAASVARRTTEWL